MKNLMKQEAGFTLLELIVVVAVIGILAAIIVPQVSDIQGDAQLSSVKSSLASVQTALERYKLDTDQGGGSYPADLEALNIDATDYSYVISGDEEHYIVVYEPDTEDTWDIGDDGSVIKPSPITEENKIDEAIYYVTSESAGLLTTN